MRLRKLFNVWFYIFGTFFYFCSIVIIVAIFYNDGLIKYNGIEVEINEYLFSIILVLGSTLISVFFSYVANSIFSFGHAEK